MLNALFIGNNINYFKNFINNIRIDNFKISAIAESKEEAKNILKKKYIDIIIINLDKNSFNELCCFINFKSFEKSIILISNKKFIIKSNIKKNIYSTILEPDNFNYISAIISSLIYCKHNNTNYNIKNMDFSIVINKIKNELKYIGYNFSYNGTTYLVEVIALLFNYDSSYNYNLEKDIYPLIAYKHKTSAHNIKCNIRNATEIMFYHNKEKVISYLNCNYNINPGSKTIISEILEKIK